MRLILKLLADEDVRAVHLMLSESDKQRVVCERSFGSLGEKNAENLKFGDS